MKRAVVGSILVAAGLTMLSASGPPVAADVSRTAQGLGNITFGHDGKGIALFDFNIADGESLSGRLVFAGEDGHHYPEIVIQADTLRSARFSFRKVEFTADGLMHDEPVRIKAIAFDGAGTKKADHFSIKVFGIDKDNGGGHADFHAEGDVYKGDIQLGSIN